MRWNGVRAEKIPARERYEIGHGPRRIEHRQLDLDQPLLGVDVGHRRHRSGRSSASSSFSSAAAAAGAGRMRWTRRQPDRSFVSSAAARTRIAQSRSPSARSSSGRAASRSSSTSAAEDRRARDVGRVLLGTLVGLHQRRDTAVADLSRARPLAAASRTTDRPPPAARAAPPPRRSRRRQPAQSARPG